MEYSSTSVSIYLLIHETPRKEPTERFKGGSVSGSESDMVRSVPEEHFLLCSSSEGTAIDAADINWK